MPAPREREDGSYFSDGDENLGIQGTELTADWTNAVQEELVNVATVGDVPLDKHDNTQVLKGIQRLIADMRRELELERAGEIFFWAGYGQPPGRVLLCDGSPFPRDGETARLFEVIGTIYGAGDGATTANLPDGRGVFPRGLDDGRGLDPGRKLGEVQLDAIRSHDHTGETSRAGGHDHGGRVGAAGRHDHGGKTSHVDDHQHISSFGEANMEAPWGIAETNKRGSHGGTDDDDPWPYVSPAGAHEHDIPPDGDHEHPIPVDGDHVHVVTIAATGDRETRGVNLAVRWYIRY